MPKLTKKVKFKPMHPKEYAAVKDALNWSHDKMGIVVGVAPRTPYRYASGDVEIPEPAARLMRALVFCKLTLSKNKFERFVEQVVGQRIQ